MYDRIEVFSNLALPNYFDPVTQLDQFSRDFGIPFLVGLKLCMPILCVGLRCSVAIAYWALVPVAPMDENSDLANSKNDIRLSREFLDVFPVSTDTCFPQRLAKLLLGLCSGGSISLHRTPRRFGNDEGVAKVIVGVSSPLHESSWYRQAFNAELPVAQI